MVNTGRSTTSQQHNIIDIIGTKGTHGHLKGLLYSGLLFLKTITEADTIINANNVPIFVRVASLSKETNPDSSITMIPTIIVLFTGVPYLGCTSEKLEEADHLWTARTIYVLNHRT